MQLFPDQVNLVNEVRISLHKHDQTIACAATGFGKSLVFIDIALRAIEKSRTILILTESKKIFDQIKMRAPAILIDPKARKLVLPSGQLYIAMAQTLKNRKEFIEKFQSLGKELLIIIDECHIGTFNKLLEQFKEAQKIGFTATPDARWAKHLPTYYKGIVVGPQPHELVLNGRLSPYKHFARVSADLDLLKLHKGEFTEESQEAVFGAAKVFDGLKEDLLKLPYKKCLIFTASIKDCGSVHEQLTRAEFRCVQVHSKMTDKEFAYNLGQFTKGDINICVSVGTLTKGFDFPEIDLIVLRRKTTSLPLFLQMIGRASRWLLGKKFFTVLDYGGNYLNHGLWDMERDWKSLWNKPNKPRDGVAPIKICPMCEYIVSAGADVCANCGYQFTKKDIPLEVGKLVEITERYSKMIGKRMSQLTPEELSIYARLKDKKVYAARIAHARERDAVAAGKESRFLYEYAQCMGYKTSWVEFKRKSVKEGEKISYADHELK
jgi:superfamily II DNA or RNA helicase